MTEVLATDTQQNRSIAARRAYLPSLDAVRAAAALLIVLYHVDDVSRGLNATVLFGGFFQTGSSRGVDIFVVMTGFAITYTYWDHIGQPAKCISFIRKRFLRIYPSVWILCALAILLYSAGFGGQDKSYKLSSANIIGSLLLVPTGSTPLVNVTWTLNYIVFFYAVFALMVLSRKIGLAVLCLWQGAVVLHALGATEGGLWETIYLQPLSLEFGIGVSWALFARYAIQVAPQGVGWLLAIVGAVAFVGCRSLEAVGTLRLTGPEVIVVYGLATGIAMAGMALADQYSHRPLPNVIRIVGAATYSIYLVNYSISAIGARAFARAGLPLTNSSRGILLGAIAIVAGVGFHALVDEPMQQWLRGTSRSNAGPEERG